MSEPGEQTAKGDYLEYLRLAELVRITRRRARWRLAIGLTLALVFGGISLLSYLAAQQTAELEALKTGEGSESYYILWGPALFGAWMALRAVLVLWRLRR